VSPSKEPRSTRAITWSLTKPIEPEELQALMGQTEWARDRTVEGLETMLSATGVVIGAWRGEQLVGFARAVTDGVYRALIDDVIVDESERGRGVGDGLVRQLLDQLDGVEAVLLRCAEDVVPFYERHRF
jgi:GNAT superfamily N-acetyltransferase